MSFGETGLDELEPGKILARKVCDIGATTGVALARGVPGAQFRRINHTMIANIKPTRE